VRVIALIQRAAWPLATTTVPHVVVYLVRHGQSEWNVAKRVQGQSPHPRLTAAGREHAIHAAALIRADNADAPSPSVRTSDLQRAAETADLIAAAFRVPVTIDARLREQHLGIAQGLTSENATRILGDVDWSDDDARIPGGESAREVHARMGAVLTPLLAGAATIILVSHGDAIRMGLGWLGGYRPADTPWVQIENGAVFAIRADRSYRRL
jgi:probable phosphoglycerate mutase